MSKVQLEPRSSTEISQDPDSVYNRFCGAAMANMLYARYEKRRTCKQDQKETLEQEIQVLKCIKCSERTTFLIVDLPFSLAIQSTLRIINSHNQCS